MYNKKIFENIVLKYLFLQIPKTIIEINRLLKKKNEVSIMHDESLYCLYYIIIIFSCFTYCNL